MRKVNKVRGKARTTVGLSAVVSPVSQMAELLVRKADGGDLVIATALIPKKDEEGKALAIRRHTAYYSRTGNYSVITVYKNADGLVYSHIRKAGSETCQTLSGKRITLTSTGEWGRRLRAWGGAGLGKSIRIVEAKAARKAVIKTSTGEKPWSFREAAPAVETPAEAAPAVETPAEAVPATAADLESLVQGLLQA